MIIDMTRHSRKARLHALQMRITNNLLNQGHMKQLIVEHQVELVSMQAEFEKMAAERAQLLAEAE